MAVVTHSHWRRSPAPLRDGAGLGRAAIAEALPAGPAVMFRIIIFKGRATLVAILNKTNQKEKLLV